MRLAPRMVGDGMADDFRRHRAETEGHLRLVGLVGFFAAQPDTPPKLAGFAFALEQLEVGGYALLARVAARAGDKDTVALAELAQREERTAAAAVAGAWDAAGK